MSLSKEILHSEELSTVLSRLQKGIEANGGLLPDQFSEEDLTFLYELGYNLYQAEDFVQAADIFQRLTVARPFEAKHWQGFASSLFMQKRYEEALVPWSMWCLIDNTNPIPHFHAAESLFSLGQKEEGLKALQAAENRDRSGSLKGKIDALRTAWGQP